MLPGLLACVLAAATARLVGTTLQLGLETAVALAIGVAVGMAVAGLAPIRDALLPGAVVAARFALRLGIALLGARLTLGQLWDTGGGSVLAIVVIVVVGLLLGTVLARRLGVRRPLSALITVGMAICGNSAILALAPIVRAPHRDTVYAVSTITIFGLLGVLGLPILGALLGMSDAVVGTWAGLAVNDTAQVVATGYAVSPPAGDVATVVKLTRNLAILPVLLAASWLTVRAATGDTVGTRASPPAVGRADLIARAVPWFVVGFVVFAGLRSAGLLDASVPSGGTLADLCSAAASVLILVALAGVGLSTEVRTMLGVGARPFLYAATVWIVIGALGLALATVVAGPTRAPGGAGADAPAVYHAG